MPGKLHTNNIKLTKINSSWKITIPKNIRTELKLKLGEHPDIWIDPLTSWIIIDFNRKPEVAKQAIII